MNLKTKKYSKCLPSEALLFVLALVAVVLMCSVFEHVMKTWFGLDSNLLLNSANRKPDINLVHPVV